MIKGLKVFLLCGFLSISSLEASSVKNYFMEESANEIIKKEEIEANRGFSFEDLEENTYFGITYSLSHLDRTRTDGSQGGVSLNKSLNKNGSTLGLELGYMFNRDLDFVLNYQRSDFGSVITDNVYISSLYYLTGEKFRPYAGVNLGISYLTWDKNIISTVNSDSVSESLLYGINAGAIYKLDKFIVLNMNYQVNSLSHKTDMEDLLTKSTFKHGFHQSLGFGIRIVF